ncbi:MAG: EAL domain-containing protein [Rhodocyclales bacterium]|nr:EAL domain-containing protein [Rhodocyclales bacterium]
MNLKTKSSLAVAALMLLVFGSGLLIQDFLIQGSLKKPIADQQFMLVSRVAGEIDRRLAINLDALRRIAAGIGPELLRDPARLQTYIEDKHGVRAMFDALIVVSPRLRVLADAPRVPGRVGTDVSSLAHLQRLRATGAPVVSEPFTGKVTGRPTIALSVPVHDAEGRLVVVLSGTLDLLAPNFLGSLTERWAGDRGHFVLTTRDRYTIVDADSAKVLGVLAVPGANPVYDRALGGWEGTDAGNAGDGVLSLMSFVALKSTGWIVGAVLPVEVAFAPIRQSRRTGIALLLLASALVAWLVWLAINGVLRPMLALRDNARRLRADPSLAAHLHAGDDEVGEIARDLYRLVDELARSRRDSDNHAKELQSVLDASPVAIIRVRGRHFMSVNPAFERLVGYKAKEVVGKLADLVYLSPEAFAATGEKLYSGMVGDAVVKLEEAFRNSAGETFWTNIYARLIDPDDPDKGAVVIVEDISERRAAEAARVRSEEHMRYQAEHDALTLLPNRVLFNDRVNQAILAAQRGRRQLALMFFDLDRFKNINDTLGHDVGDQLLQMVAERVRSCVRSSDTLSRPGGDEFMLLLPEIVDPGDAAQVANKVLETLARPYSIAGHQLMLTASIGISIYPDDGEDGLTLIRNADLAMYASKDSGRNTSQYFRAEMNERARERMSLEHALRRALDQGELLLHYQPQFDIATRRIIGMEALVRWRDPATGQLVPPGRFIPVAEDTGLILPLGTWVLGEACRQNGAWQAAGLPRVPVAVNISALQFRQTVFVAAVEDALRLSGLDARWLELELTESVTMHAIERNIEILGVLRAQGVKVSIDDFGTGHSSLSYLKRLPIDTLKIDQAFVRDIVTDEDDAEIVAAIIGLAHNLGLDVIAEGVETEAQLECLQRRGCGKAQGYFFARPLPADELEQFWCATVEA